MKFGKSIRAESRSNRGLAFINFKFLKRIIKRSAVASRAGYADTAVTEDAAFLSALDAELAKVAVAYWNELKEIAVLQESVSAASPSLESLPDSELYRNMTFEQLQAHLEGLGGLRESDNECTTHRSPSVASTVASPTDAGGGGQPQSSSMTSSPRCSSSSTSDSGGAGGGELPAAPTAPLSATSVTASARASVALCEFCVTLGQLSARCKRLRGCVLWNVVAVVKILKKRQKQHGSGSARLPAVSAMDILARQAWYREPKLPQIVSTVETTIGDLMSRLSNRLPCRDEYRCPICLEVVLDPVCLRTCGHRFCWACLCQAYLDKPDGTLERCPTCRSAFALDPLAFQVDGILARFLRSYFPEEIDSREQEQKECLRLRLRRQLDDSPLPPTVCCPDCPCPTINKTLVERAATWVGETELCAHALRVRSGKPADVSHLVMKDDNSNNYNTYGSNSTKNGGAAEAAALPHTHQNQSSSIVKGVICKLLDDEDDFSDIEIPPILEMEEEEKKGSTGGGSNNNKSSTTDLKGNGSSIPSTMPNAVPAGRNVGGGGGVLPILEASKWRLPTPSKFVVADDEAVVPEAFLPIIIACKSMRIRNALDDEDDIDYARSNVAAAASSNSTPMVFC